MASKVNALHNLATQLGASSTSSTTIAGAVHEVTTALGATASEYNDESSIARSIQDIADAIEDGAISIGGAGNGLIVNYDNETALLDKTWQEIHDALESMKVTIALSTGAYLVASATGNDHDGYTLTVYFNNETTDMFSCSSADDYPTDD